METTRTRYRLVPGDIAQHFEVHEETVRQWCRKRQIDCKKIGGRWRISEDVVKNDDAGGRR